MRWAFVGIGRVTHRMVDAVRSAGHEIALVAGRDAQKLRHWQDQFGVSQGTTDLAAACESASVDAVYIALPPSLHAQYAVTALGAGKRVLCEKALAASVQQAQQIRQAVLATKIPLLHATAFPHHPRSEAMRRLILSGELGEICRVTVACSVGGILERKDHRSNPDLGGGCLLDLGWYCVYSTLWFTGFRPSDMQSLGTRFTDKSDSVWYQVQTVAKLEADSSRLCPLPHRSVLASWDCGYEAIGRKWIEIAGTQSSVICDDFLRPWDIEKPRFWVHGSDGKARAELVGESVFQEASMVRSLENISLDESLDALTLAIETQTILSEIEATLRA